MEAAGSSETSILIYQITRRHIPEDSHSGDDFKSSSLICIALPALVALSCLFILYCLDFLLFRFWVPESSEIQIF
jgi:hypothetical protein